MKNQWNLCKLQLNLIIVNLSSDPTLNVSDQMKNQEAEFEDPDALELELPFRSPAHPMQTDITIRIAKDQYSVYELLRKEAQGRIVLAPNFQRKDVWNNNQRCELIESVLLGIPIPLIYLFESEDGIRQIIDGKQRITSLKLFINNELKLTNLVMLSNLDGKTFADIDPQLQARIEDYQINTYVIQPPTPEYVKFNIFDRVNRGGTRLNKQEMRHALYQGKVTELLENLTQNQHFKLATGDGVKPERMRDKYLILRFISFYLYRTGQLGSYQYKSDIDEFLAYVMKFINQKADDTFIEQLQRNCEWGLHNVYRLLGSEAFRFAPVNGSKRRQINMGLFEMLVFAFKSDKYSQLSADKIRQNIESRKAMIDDQGLFSGIVDSTSYVDMRFDIADEISLGLEQELKNA